MLNGLKILVEILAIIFAGVFALLTWGVDIVEDREPSWDLSVVDSKSLRMQKIDGTDQLETCDTIHDCDVVACKFPGTLEIINKGQRPIDVHKTSVELFFVDKKTMPTTTHAEYSHDKDITPFSLLSLACNPDAETGECANAPSASVDIEPLDDESPLFSTNTAKRPFGFEVYRGEHSKQYFESHGLLIRVRQAISATDPIYFWKKKVYTSTALVYSFAPCWYGSEFKNPDEK